jgi:uncharacterized protein YidB (DUF937 family)
MQRPLQALVRNRPPIRAPAVCSEVWAGCFDKLQQGGLGNAINSWIGSGQNQPVSPSQLGSALGPGIIKMLAQRSGMSEEEVTRQLSQILAGGRDKLTLHGRLPRVPELSQTT